MRSKILGGYIIGKLVLGIIVLKPAKSAGTKKTLPCSGRETCMGVKAV